MRDQLDVLLIKAQEQIDVLHETIWPSLTAADEISGEALYAVRSVVQDLQSALDWVATAVDRAHGRGRDRSPYFPLRESRSAVEAQLKRDFPGLQTRAPEAYEAITRHQPYVNGREMLGHLHNLARVNKHQHFTKQVRDSRRHWGVSLGGLSVQYNEGRGLTIGGPPPYGHMLVGQAAISDDGTFAFSQGDLVTWNFAVPNEAVQTTLVLLHGLVVDACVDVCDAAGI